LSGDRVTAKKTLEGNSAVGGENRKKQFVDTTQIGPPSDLFCSGFAEYLRSFGDGPADRRPDRKVAVVGEGRKAHSGEIDCRWIA